MKFLSLAPALAVLALGALSCSDGDTTPLGPSRVVGERGLGPVIGFEVVSDRPRGVVVVGDTVRFTARATHVSGGARDVDAAWRVRPAGVLRPAAPASAYLAVAPGSVVVTATYVTAAPERRTYRAESALTVLETVPVPVRHVIEGFPDGPRLLAVGDRRPLSFFAVYRDGSRSEPLTAQWSSSDPAVADVGPAGSLRVLAPGSFRVTARVPAATVTTPTWSVDRGGNLPPVVAARCFPCEAGPGEAVNLAADRASDPDGDRLTAVWTVSSGVLRYPERFRTSWFLPPHEGTFRATVVVTDSAGNTATDFLDVDVVLRP